MLMMITRNLLWNKLINRHSKPSVIGAQEVYKDPRQRRMEAAEQEKTLAKQRDGAKLSFQEKMKLFAAESGGGGEGGARDKAKTSRVQRDLEAEPTSSQESQ